MRGPGLRVALDLRRLWRCPACGRERKLGKSETSVLCRCQDPPAFMQLIEGKRVVRPEPRPVARFMEEDEFPPEDADAHGPPIEGVTLELVGGPARPPRPPRQDREGDASRPGDRPRDGGRDRGGRPPHGKGQQRSPSQDRPERGRPPKGQPAPPPPPASEAGPPPPPRTDAPAVAGGEANASKPGKKRRRNRDRNRPGNDATRPDAQAQPGASAQGGAEASEAPSNPVPPSAPPARDEEFGAGL